ncbi:MULTISPECIES: hypothetical protein [Metabacillus]|uniref:Uncharacterized protein n=1 Tax=Metabacillus indicus TaxID=246786 RepID=A0A084H050_METID|nr:MULTISPECIES: hypothetical protein [Metabacillus]KEZ50637.1 hypothetical protein AZ46_0208230 [Metabacillus indicus LMG 22858]KEZ52962.1 hypothetical protein GS18_0209075 [Metabacillus indicus]MDX8291718.1 hypothetical protein [Metabacillus indicus]
MKTTIKINDDIKQAFYEIYGDLDMLLFMAKNGSVFNQFEVKRIEGKLKQNLKAVEFLIVSQDLTKERG